jgi:hypothetical protein
VSIDQLNELEDLLPKLSSAITAIRLDDTAKRALEELKDAPRQAKRFEAFVRAIQTLGPGCGGPQAGPPNCSITPSRGGRRCSRISDGLVKH